MNQLTQTAAWPGNVKYRPQSAADLALRAGSVDVRQADAAGRRPVRLRADAPIPKPPSAGRAICLDAARRSVMRPARPKGVNWNDHHAAHGRRVRRVRQREDGRQVQPRQVHARLHGEQQRPRPQSAHPHDRQHDARVDRQGRGPLLGLQPGQRQQQRRMRTRGRARTSAKRCSRAPTTRSSSADGATANTTGSWGVQSNRRSRRAWR